MTATTTDRADRTSVNRALAARLPFRSALPVALVLAVVLGLIGGLLFELVGALVGVVAGVGLAVAWAFFMAAGATTGVLRVVGAAPVEEGVYPRLENLVESLSISTGVEEPDLAVLEDPHANLLVAGPAGQATLVVTSGLLELLTRVELEGVLAAGLGRIGTGDAHLATLAAVFIGGPLLRNGPRRSERPAAVAGFAASWRARRMAALFQEHRHLLADLHAASITRYPPGLESALTKIASLGTTIEGSTWGTAHLWMFDPLPSDGDPAAGGAVAPYGEAFRLHPPIVHRIDLLAEL